MIRYNVVKKYRGYEHKRDITNMDPGTLIRGSKNVFINDYEKIESRKGFILKGAAKTVDIGIRSSYDDFVNVKGVKLPIREWPSGDPAQRDILQVWYQSAWHTITPLSNSAPVAVHEFNFAEWWDFKNLQSKLIWVNGNSGANAISSWNGAIATILSTTVNTITIAGPDTWQSLGFNSPTGSVVINGIAYAYTGGTGTQTLTGVTPDPTASVNPGDLAFDLIETQGGIIDGVALTGYTFDICSTLYNQVYYGSYASREVLVSQVGNFSSIGITSFNGTGLDDGVFSGTYTGALNATYKVTIDSVDPATNTQAFTGTGTPIFFDTTGYSGTGDNKYVLKCIFTQIFTCGTYVGTITPGEPIRGATSGAYGTLNDDPQAAINETSVHLLSGAFEIGEVVTGQFSGATFVITAIREANSVVFFKNDVQIPLSIFHAGNGILDDNGVPRATPLTLVDGLAFIPNVQNTYINLDYGDYVELNINAGGPDMFVWSKDNSALSAPTAITGAAQLLSDGISFTFLSTTGHTVGDSWTINVIAEILDGYRDFSFSKPLRLPGEGARLLLDSPPVGMRPQEKEMYINSQVGSWFINQFTLSADLKSEDLNIIKLKSEPQNQVQHHNLMGYVKNSLMYVSKDNTFDKLGRVYQITTPQTFPISYRVQLDFDAFDFTNGTIKFYKNREYISAPNDGVLMVYDDELKVWQPPQYFPVGRLSVIDDKLCGHSYQSNETYELFNGGSDNGQPIETICSLSYQNYGLRANMKSFNELYVEGYIRANTTLTAIIRYEIDGCGMEIQKDINGDARYVCIGGEDRSLGKRNLGNFSLAALRTLDDPDGPFPKFRVDLTTPRYNFYEVMYTFYGYGIDQRWALLAVGAAVKVAEERNQLIKN